MSVSPVGRRAMNQVPTGSWDPIAGVILPVANRSLNYKDSIGLWLQAPSYCFTMSQRSIEHRFDPELLVSISFEELLDG